MLTLNIILQVADVYPYFINPPRGSAEPPEPPNALAEAIKAKDSIAILKLVRPDSPPALRAKADAVLKEEAEARRGPDKTSKYGLGALMDEIIGGATKPNIDKGDGKARAALLKRIKPPSLAGGESEAESEGETYPMPYPMPRLGKAFKKLMGDVLINGHNWDATAKIAMKTASETDADVVDIELVHELSTHVYEAAKGMYARAQLLELVFEKLLIYRHTRAFRDKLVLDEAVHDCRMVPVHDNQELAKELFRYEPNIVLL